MILPVAVRVLAASSAKRAMPKSVIFTVRSVENDVGGLDVPVDHSLAVGCRQARRHLRCDGGRLVRGQGAAHRPLLGQAPAVDELHDQVEPAVVGAEVVHAHDVRMVETGRGLCLQAEPLDVRRLVRSQELDRDGAPENLVSRSPHLAHRAASQRLIQLIAVCQQHLHTHPES
jgi:hypothetical protein